MHHIFIVQFFDFLLNLLILVPSEFIVTSHPGNHVIKLSHSFNRLWLRLWLIFFTAEFIIFIWVWEIWANFNFYFFLRYFIILFISEFLLTVFCDLQPNQNEFNHKHLNASDVKLVAPSDINQSNDRSNNQWQRYSYDREEWGQIKWSIKHRLIGEGRIKLIPSEKFTVQEPVHLKVDNAKDRVHSGNFLMPWIPMLISWISCDLLAIHESEEHIWGKSENKANNCQVERWIDAINVCLTYHDNHTHCFQECCKNSETRYN